MTSSIVAELDLLTNIINKKNAQLRDLNDLVKTLYHEKFGAVTECVPLSHYVVALNGGKSLAGIEDCENKVLKTGAVTYDYFREWDVKNLPIDYAPRVEDKVSVGDLLISRMNTQELVGACAYVWRTLPKTYLPDRLWRATLSDNANPVFVWQALIQEDAKIQIRSLSSGTSGTMKNISKPRLLSVKVPLVAKNKQDSFAVVIHSIEEKRYEIAISIKEIENLLTARMIHYFG